MKKLIKILFAAFLCIPFTLSAQWTDHGSYIKTNDNVGIGVSNNTYTFYARTNKSGWQGRFANRGGAGSDVYLAHGAGYGMHIRGWTTDSKYTLQLYNANTQTNVFYNDGRVGLGLVGNVGIGTVAPAGKLTVVSSSNQDGIVSLNPNGNTHLPWVNGWSYISGLGIVFRTNGNTERMRIISNGNVGIGTDNPTNKLSVNGNIRAKEVKVETGWSDYVFYDNYQLPTLEEEEKHIEEKGHLLGFESEADMNGETELGDVAKRQQAKIEEMMLHLIDMNKKVEKLQAENAAIKAELEAIKK